jgi:hypothetical protein
MIFGLVFGGAEVASAEIVKIRVTKVSEAKRICLQLPPAEERKEGFRILDS